MTNENDKPSSTSHSAPVRQIIGNAVIAVLSEAGIGKLTHRAVAKAAGISLSVTTYYYATKADMLADASQRLMDGYLSRFRSIARDHRHGKRPVLALEVFSTLLVMNAAGAHRTSTTAWYEIILNSPRSREGTKRASKWFSELLDIWSDLAAAMGEESDPARIQNAIDRVVGLQLMVIALRLTKEQVSAVAAGSDPVAAWQLPAELKPADAEPPQKLDNSKTRILQAAIDLLIEEGPGSVSYRKIAERTGAAQSAPAYYFGSISDLLNAAQIELFRSSKTRYRKHTSENPNRNQSISDIADLTTAIIIREATEFGLNSVAHYSLWLEAGRNDRLRPDVQLAIRDQIFAWKRRLSLVMPTSNNTALYFQAQFLGQLIRLIATGAEISALSDIRHLHFQSLETQLKSMRSGETS
ncbi:TetR/AcrR family transcriptional regulator [Hoeflea alexandrii]|uniref:TetR/AcrR family transcriptional regulator n=1 Tax=Hoeflea alexandrii TaxID=288436 RepID=UPI0022AE5F85|nr:TetR family transcriptional regulator [Hoeflea alexandrii]MCZ4291575.1 TetR family transcriptional regulator [Hoeflea alexandrii]